MAKRCDRNRNRSKRRAIYCPIHGRYLDSVSRKYPLFADKPEQLRARGFNRRSALTLIQGCTTVPIQGEWLEAFWCDDCQETYWYHVHKRPATTSSGRASYELIPAPESLWQQATGVLGATGNPSVSEFTRTVSRLGGYQGAKGFRYL